MRTTLLAQSRQTLLNLRAAAERRTRATNEVSSGLRVVVPSDSPSDAAGVVRTRADLASIGSFQKNLGAVRSELQTVDGAMFDAVQVLQRGLSLATQAANGVETAASREMIAGEVEGVLRHVMSIANTVYNGRYVFGGAADSREPFVVDGSGEVAYRGDAGSRSVLFPDGRPAQVSLPGDAVFLTPDELVGSGRTPAVTGAEPSPPVGIGLSFSGDVEAVISVDLAGFFVASAPPSGAASGDTVTVSLTSDDGKIVESITTPPLAGGEDAAALAGLLNDQIAANPDLAGLLTFSDQGGALKLTVSDAAGTGFSFSSSSTGSVTTGLESGGSVGGYSAEEIAAALNAAVEQNEALSGAGIVFTVRDGEVALDGNVDFTVTAVDFARGTEFASGLAGTYRVGGVNSADVFGTLTRLINVLRSNNGEGIADSVVALQRAVDHVSGSQSFFGSTLRQVQITLDSLSRLEVVNQERLSRHQEADILDSISALELATSAEQFALQVAARQQPTLLDVLG